MSTAVFFPAEITADIPAILANACADYGVTLAAIQGYERTAAIVQVRQEVMAAIVLAGYTCARAGHVLLRDHSTVLHGVNRVLADPERALRARGWAGRAASTELPALLARAISDPIPLRYIIAYVTTTLLGSGHAPGHHCAYGLSLLRQERYRSRVAAALTGCGMAAMVSRVDQHVAALSS